MTCCLFQSEFMSLEVVNSHVRFTWDAGAGAASIEHELPIALASDKIAEEDKWYKVKANR